MDKRKKYKKYLWMQMSEMPIIKKIMTKKKEK